MNLKTSAPAAPRDGSCVEKSSLPLVATRARKILIADVDAVIRQAITSVLARDGLVVVVTNDGEQAGEALRRAHYDLLVTDNQMPCLTGRKLIERIRQAGLSLPIIVVSGSFPAEGVRDNPQLQITAVLPKPFEPVALLDIVRKVLRLVAEAASAEHRTFRQFHASPQPIRKQNYQP